MAIVKLDNQNFEKEILQSKGTALVDFYADFVAENGAVRRELYLDGMHPTAQGHALMAARLTAVLEGLV